MRIIGFGIIDKNIIPVLLGCLFCFLTRLLFTVPNAQLFHHAIISNLVGAFSKLFAFIPLIILKIRTGKKNNAINKFVINNNISLAEPNNKKNEKNIIKLIYIILTSLLTFIHGLIIIYTLGIKSNCWILEILMTSIFYYLIFKEKLYKHHYFSLIIIILTGVVLDLVLGNLQNDFNNNLLLLLLRLIREILFSLVEVINKYLMEKKFCSIYEIYFLSGLFLFLFFVIFSILNYYYFELDNFVEYFNNFNSTELLVGLGVLITQFALGIFLLITNKNYTPCHIFIAFVFGQLAYYMDFSTDSIISICFFILILFMSLVFTEIIEINICGLSENTRKHIIERANNDNNFDKKLTMYSIYEDNENAKNEIELQKALTIISSNGDDDKKNKNKIELGNDYIIKI